MKNSEQSLKDFWELSSKWTCTSSKSQKEKREKGTGTVVEEIMAENLPDLMKHMSISIQEAPWSPDKMNKRYPHWDTLWPNF